MTTNALPVLKQVPSPNYSSRGGARISKIVVHDTEGSYAGAVAWFAQKISQVSAHLVMREDGGEVTQCVALDANAWAVCAYNRQTISIEGAGSEANGFSDAWWATMATLVAWLLHRYDLPCREAASGVGDGFCSHADLGAAGGGHHDPAAVGTPRWAQFVRQIADAYAAFAAAPLPDWALHGLPAPSTVSPPPLAAEGETSHGGAPGVEPGDVAHPPVVGSLQWAQERLVALKIPLALVDGFACDGLDGPMTRAAVKQFQTQVGFAAADVDGLVGAKTIAALQRSAAKAA
jgi:N-acetyl-anhydromuramyl-L-alanine amidase AmpD